MKVAVDLVDRTATLSLTDSDRRNAITLEMVKDLQEVLAELAADPKVLSVIVTGDGTSFCAGADRGLLGSADEESLRSVYEAFMLIWDFPLPTVAAVNGPAVGAGLNLALACDVRIAAESAVFDSRFVRLPIHPGGGHTWLLRRATNSQAVAALALFGEPVRGPRAVEIGLAWKCVPDGDLLAETRRLCGLIQRTPRALLTDVKNTIRTAPELASHAEALEFELARQLRSVESPEYLRDMKRGAR